MPSLSWGQVSTAQGSSSKGSASKGSSSKGSATIALPGSTAVMEAAAPEEKGLATAVLAGGCFWCLESDFEKCPGVVDIVSGYSGGRSSNPTYENYSLSGHREVVLVTYSPAEITFTGICEWLVKHIDPTDPRGQFIDRGLQYSPAIYYETEDEKQAAQEVIKALKAAKVYGRKSVNLKVLPRVEFYPAEDYHQNYHSTHPTEYQNYRQTTGRDAFVTRIWGADSQRLQLPASTPSKPSAADEKERPWMAFKKPGPVELRESLTAIQYEVTQGDGTEPAFRNEYWDNKSEGLYVDVVSGAPLFSSRDKFKSGTGWPSFVRPIEADALTLAVDHKLGYARTEVRSRYGDSHLGHVFSDGPRDRGGKRYCMNSAAMRFIPVDKLESEGYGAYLEYFE